MASMPRMPDCGGFRMGVLMSWNDMGTAKEFYPLPEQKLVLKQEEGKIY